MIEPAPHESVECPTLDTVPIPPVWHTSARCRYRSKSLAKAIESHAQLHVGDTLDCTGHYRRLRITRPIRIETGHHAFEIDYPCPVLDNTYHTSSRCRFNRIDKRTGMNTALTLGGQSTPSIRSRPKEEGYIGTLLLTQKKRPAQDATRHTGAGSIMQESARITTLPLSPTYNTPNNTIQQACIPALSHALTYPLTVNTYPTTTYSGALTRLTQKLGTPYKQIHTKWPKSLTFYTDTGINCNETHYILWSVPLGAGNIPKSSV